MERVVTRDGSITYYNEAYCECYHSITGAIEESEKKFVVPANLSAGMKVLDVCFGLGYNSMVAIRKAKRLEIVGLEKDKEILRKAQSLHVEGYEKEYHKIRVAAKEGHYKDDDVEITLILGDATSTIKSIDKKFDAVFLDPFSPPKNKELWTEDFFKDLKKRMRKNSILTTYSCARVVRENLKKAGFKIRDGPIVGRRGPSTIAQA